MAITAFYGSIGAGKSSQMTRKALADANFKEKGLLTNYPLDLEKLLDYCEQFRYRWLWHHVYEHGVTCCTTATDLVQFLEGRENVIACLDEAGVFTNYHAVKNLPPQFLADLCMSRKMGVDLYFAAQFDAQVARQLRDLVQYVVHCEGWSKYNKETKRPEQVWKKYFVFKQEDYLRWQASRMARTSLWRTYFGFAIDTSWGPMSDSDRLIFTVFDSFNRLDLNESEHLTYKPDPENPREYRPRPMDLNKPLILGTASILLFSVLSTCSQQNQIRQLAAENEQLRTDSGSVSPEESDIQDESNLSEQTIPALTPPSERLTKRITSKPEPPETSARVRPKPHTPGPPVLTPSTVTGDTSPASSNPKPQPKSKPTLQQVAPPSPIALPEIHTEPVATSLSPEVLQALSVSAGLDSEPTTDYETLPSATVLRGTLRGEVVCSPTGNTPAVVELDRGGLLLADTVSCPGGLFQFSPTLIVTAEGEYPVPSATISGADGNPHQGLRTILNKRKRDWVGIGIQAATTLAASALSDGGNEIGIASQLYGRASQPVRPPEPEQVLYRLSGGETVEILLTQPMNLPKRQQEQAKEDYEQILAEIESEGESPELLEQLAELEGEIRVSKWVQDWYRDSKPE